MPLQMEYSDFSARTYFDTSSILEMIMWIQTLASPYQNEEWRNEVEELLGPEYLRKTMDFFKQFHMGCDFVEIAIEYPDKHDIKGFLEHIKQLTNAEFIFYILGRTFPLQDINDDFKKADFARLLEKYPASGFYTYPIECSSVWLGNIQEVKEILIDLFLNFYNKVFSQKVHLCQPAWLSSIAEKEAYLHQHGGKALMELIKGRNTLPIQIPEETPFSEIVYIPITKMSKYQRTYFGYGNITILYDANRTEQSILKAKEARGDVLSIMRALCDENRLKMIKFIGDEAYSLNGKKLAERMALSPSVVSRHLAQLRDAKLIKEQSTDNRNITYRLDNKRLSELSDLIMLYLSN